MSRPDHDVRLLRVAEEDLADILSYIAADRPAAADALASRFEKDLSLLGGAPLLGRMPKEADLARQGYRYIVVDTYLVFYTVEPKLVLVHRVLHGARDYQSLL